MGRDACVARRSYWPDSFALETSGRRKRPLPASTLPPPLWLCQTSKGRFTCHSERSEESAFGYSNRPGHRFFAALRMTGRLVLASDCWQPRAKLRKIPTRQPAQNLAYYAYIK